jgi:dUTP pyrophosphatase
MKINVINKSKYQLRRYSTGASVGMDPRANLRPRSGLAIKKGIPVLNSPGTIDADYRGEVCVILVNLSNENLVIEDGERICQMIISKHEKAEWESVDTLLESERGIGGIGHTGKK